VTPSTFASALAAAAPGTILLLGAGTYPSFTMSKSGTANQPIVIRGESADTVTIGGRVTLDNLQWAVDIGYAVICHPDFASAEGYSTKLRLVRTKTLMQGHDCCNHRWLWKE
jgi:hypothetical protein